MPTSLAWVVIALRSDPFMNLLKKSLAVEPTGATANFGHLFFRVAERETNQHLGI